MNAMVHPSSLPGAVRKAAEEASVDISIILENLKMTPTERIERHDSMVADLLHFQKSIAAQRAAS